MKTDKEIVEDYLTKKPWGMSTTIDLYDCDPAIIRNGDKIKKFAIELCDYIEMKRFGDPVVVNFGEDPRVSGFSMTQLIETSLISGHFANASNAAYIDVFSCKEYPPEKTAQFCKDFFKAKKMRFNVTFRI
ncbi:MAG: S-adenosylmethionine decarboxylase [Patescibacteria group bacterium]